MSQTQTQTAEPLSNYYQVDYAQPHWARKKKILEKFPEMKDLYAPDPMSAVYATVLSASIFFMAYLLQNQPLWVIFLSAYVVGATIDHSLWVLIHDFTHNAAFKDRNLNMIFLLVSNLPHIFPSAVSFRYYHLLHHSFLNETYADPDVPGPTEARIFGHSSVGKMAWLAFFPLLQTLRTLRYSSGAFSLWMVANWVANLSLAACVLYFISFNGFLFMLISSIFSIGFHPLGGRWIAEHWAVKPPQETYSYYGPLNRVAFNIGYHNEHHDLPEVPWSKLPEVRKRAPEFYDSLYWHDSYLRVLAQFFFSPEFTLTSRVVRKPRKYE
eukprot:TRINITY_DN2153_c0_g2_i1.p1 TRINITY_DN2153_c0_g2~~TRINITY_DN2153_c0_g2_i1.p1  ORF type:complete len:325 (-),score=55.36 TRINITY_DN2153_c0_g2_i1:171-1145(-)